MRGQADEGRDIEVATKRRAAFVAALPTSLTEAEDALPRALATANAAVRSKLRKIYLVADEIASVREPFVACAKGCSSCCNMNVLITAAEADILAGASGRMAADLHRSTRHARDKFAGEPCPFLDGGGMCSVYADRPLACRKHASFFTHAGPCHPSVMNKFESPQARFTGLDQALFDVSKARRDLVLADIRDFFPPRKD